MRRRTEPSVNRSNLHIVSVPNASAADHGVETPHDANLEVLIGQFGNQCPHAALRIGRFSAT
jgi:hypothetical protein